MHTLSSATLQLINALLRTSQSAWWRAGRSRRSLALLDQIAEQRELGAIPYLIPLLFDAAPVGFAAQQAVATILEPSTDDDLFHFDSQLRHFSVYRSPFSDRHPRADDVANLEIADGTKHAVLGVLSCHPSGYIREAAVHRLGAITTEEEAPYLLLRLNDWVAPVREAARQRVQERLAKGQFSGFLKHLPLVLRLHYCGRDDHHQIVGAILRALWRVESAAIFRQALVSPSRWLRREIYRSAMAEEGHQRDLAISTALCHYDSVLRLWAIRAAAKHFSKDRLSLAIEGAQGDPFPPIRREVIQIRLEHFPDRLPAALRSGLFDDHAGIRGLCQFHWKKRDLGDASRLYRDMLNAKLATIGVVAGLGETGTHDDLLWVRPLLKHDAPRIRSAAVAAFARLAHRDEMESLVAHLEDNSSQVVAATVRCLAMYPGAISPDHLMEIWRKSVDRRRIQGEVFRLLRTMDTWAAMVPMIELLATAEEPIATRTRDYIASQATRVFTAPTAQQRADIRNAMTQYGDVLEPAFVVATSTWVESRAR